MMNVTSIFAIVKKKLNIVLSRKLQLHKTLSMDPHKVQDFSDILYTNTYNKYKINN